MNTVHSSEDLSGLSLKSDSTVSEVVDLFNGLSVKIQLSNFVRVIHSSFESTPLGVGTKSSRFSSASHKNNETETGEPKVLYSAQNIGTALYESIVRDRFDLNPNRTLVPASYNEMSVVTFSSERQQVLNLLDLTRGKATRYRVPTDVIRSSDHTEGQHFSQFVYKNMPDIHGLLYSSRFTDEGCVALYFERAISKIVASDTVSLVKNLITFAMKSQNIQVVNRLRYILQRFRSSLDFLRTY